MDSAPEPPPGPLIGTASRTWVQDMLSQLGPNEARPQILAKAGLQHPLCGPLLGMVDHLGISRYEAHRVVLASAKRQLLASVQQCDAQGERLKLERLLAASFTYLGFQELREVPLAVMEKLDAVPPVFLKQLTADKDIFKELPRKVQRQVWEFDKKLLQSHALPFVGQYKYEVATIMRALAADEFLPQVLATTQKAAADTAAQAMPGASPPALPAPAPARPSLAAFGGVEEEGPGQGGGGGAASRGRGRGRGRGGQGRAAAGTKPQAAPQQQGQGQGQGEWSLPRAITRKILRKGSYVVQALKGMVGGSQKIYNQIVELCMVKYRDSEGLYVSHADLSYCTLRSQLLMALHDDSSPVAATDKCHKLAWTIDAGITNGFLTEKHLQELSRFFSDLESESQRQARAAQQQLETSSQAGKVKAKALLLQDAEESAGNVTGSLVDPLRVLGDASCILRDPSAMHLLCSAALQMTEVGSLSGQLPRADRELVKVLRMLQLGVDGKQMLRNSTYRFPEPDERVLRDVLPLLAAWHLDYEASGAADPASRPAALTGPDPPGGWGVEPGDEDSSEGGAARSLAVEAAVQALKKSEVARRLVQVFALERLVRGDLLGCCRCCKLLATSLGGGALLEGFDFAGALALRLAELVKARKVSPGDNSLWLQAVDGILVKAVDAQTQVHEEVLRLLLAASPMLEASALASYLTQTLENSKRSRKRLSKKQKEQGLGGPLQALGDFYLAALGSDIGSDIGSDGWPGITKLKLSASDGVRSVYSRFAELAKLKSKEVAPALHAYLEESQMKSS
ncbi:hypothetical protein QJQ45_020067 [Haematococcus lacustris]|nr:hypothetical protein QJQ45_020067 [Haematococcus lacustris]